MPSASHWSLRSAASSVFDVVPASLVGSHILNIVLAARGSAPVAVVAGAVQGVGAALAVAAGVATATVAAAAAAAVLDLVAVAASVMAVVVAVQQP